MANALYILSSLPNVDLYSSAAVVFENFEDFLDQCRVLEENLAEKVILAIVSPKTSNAPIAKRWAMYEYSIKNILAERRAQALEGRAYAPSLIHDEVPISAEAFDVLEIVQQEHNSYIREQKIIESKWRILEMLDSTYQFRIENVIIYGWKLQLYHSYRNLTTERGTKQWNSLLTSLAEKSGFEISTITGGF